MMNPYIISPNVVKISLDKGLSNQFSQSCARLNWRPLTTNLESCEELPYLYFRITLKTRQGSDTFAGFATGAPFMLTRDKDVKKRAFFLRHWVRRTPERENSNAPLIRLSHMAVAACDDFLLVRVDIDRQLAVEDTFKSIPFATWMFQVVQVDAVIEDLPGVRFAFAIERTVTVEEREFVAKSGLTLPSKGPKVKQSPSQLTQSMAPRPQATPHAGQTSPTPRPARPLLGQSIVNPAMHQNVQPRPNMNYNPVIQRSPAASYQPNPYAYASNRPVPLQMRQNVAPRPSYLTPQASKPPPQRGYSRAVNPIPTSAPASVDNQRPVMHPYLRLWEDRDLDDPYEPIFVTEDQKYEEQARKHWLVEREEDHARRFEYETLFAIPTSDYPLYYFDGQTVTSTSGEPDVEVVVEKKRRIATQASDDSSESEDDEKVNIPAKYNNAVISAADYNSQLKNERDALKKWLIEDISRDEEESEEQEEEDDGDGDSSE